MGSKSQKTTTENKPPKELSEAYKQIMNLAGSAGKQPLQQYSGPMIAGFTPDQKASFDAVRNSQGIWQPYVNTAAQYGAAGAQAVAPGVNTQVQDPYLQKAQQQIAAGSSAIADKIDPYAGTGYLSSAADYTGQGAQSIAGSVPQWSQDALSEYFDPYQKSVIDTTMANMQHQDQLAQQNLMGGAIQSGASPFGGDRAGIAAAELAKNQSTARNTTLAGLQSAGYNQATQQFNTQQDLARRIAEGDRSALQGAAQQYGNLSQLALLPEQMRADLLSGDRSAQMQGAGLTAGLGQQALAGEQLKGLLGNQDAQRALEAAGLFGGLGQQAQQQQLTGAAGLAAQGAQQQALDQRQLDIARQQAEQSYAYPRDMASWGASLISGAANPFQSYGTQTTTQPGPSLFGQIAGLGMAAAGMPWGAMAGLPTFDRGGRVDRRGLGGYVPHRAGGGVMPVSDIEIPMLPTAGNAGSGGLEGINIPQVAPTQPQSAGIKGLQGGDIQFYGEPLEQIDWRQFKPIETALPADMAEVFNDMAWYGRRKDEPKKSILDGSTRRQGVSRDEEARRKAYIRAVNRAAGGGVGGLAPEQQAMVRMGLGMMQDEPSEDLMMEGLGPLIEARLAGGKAAGGAVELDRDPMIDDSGETIRIRFPDRSETLDTGLPVRRNSGGEVPRRAFGGDLKPWQMGLINAGLGMMASDSPYPLAALGEGGLYGMKAYGAAREDWKEREKEKRQKELREQIFGGGLGSDLGSDGPAVPRAERVSASDGPSRRVAAAHGSVDPTIRSGIEETASALGIDPVDLATAISYETGGTFDPTKAGPTTKWGRHRGLIQFGEPQAKQYGVDWENPVGSQLGADGAVAKYLRDAGVKPGMGLLDIYSAINAGGVGRYDRSDEGTGGAPGTVADKVNKQMADHRAKALAMFGGGDEPRSAQPVQVASLDPSVGLPESMAYAPSDLPPDIANSPFADAWGGLKADPTSPKPPVPMPIPQQRAPSRSPYEPGDPVYSTDAGRRVTQTLLTPEGLGGAPMPMQTGGLGAMPMPPTGPGAPIAAPVPPAPAAPPEPEDPYFSTTMGAEPLAPENISQFGAFPAAPTVSRSQPVSSETTQSTGRGGGSLRNAPVDQLQNAYATLMLDGDQEAAAVVAMEIKRREGEQPEYDFTSVDGRLFRVDKRTGEAEPVYEPEATTDDIREYEYDRGQGYKGTLGEWMREQKKAGATNVTTNVGEGSSEYNKALDKKFAEQYISIQDGAQAARNKIATLEGLGSALAETGYTGMGAESMLAAKRAARMLGFDIGEDLGPEETARALGNQLALQLRSPSSGAGMPGAMSDKDREFLVASVPGLAKGPEGNKRLLNYMMRVEQRNIEVAKLAQDYADRNGQIDNGFFQELSKWSEANPLFPEAQRTERPKKTGPVEIDGYVIEEIE